MQQYVNMVLAFFQNHMIISAAVALAVIIFIWKKPGEAFKAAVFLVGMAVVFYILSLLGGTMFDGVDRKNDVTQKTENALRE
ncbi:MAG: hypothetical protein CSB24_03405 [Deltaproteobacteria bacterium]|nr:MAG: hypothetical protein CSB24_03405 [Deltaproteobacteria bacterium]